MFKRLRSYDVFLPIPSARLLFQELMNGIGQVSVVMEDDADDASSFEALETSKTWYPFHHVSSGFGLLLFHFHVHWLWFQHTHAKKLEILCKAILDYDIYIYMIYNYTRAARGGGGSFKNRKRIGKIRCCESQLSERKHSPIVQRSNSLTISELVS